MNIFEQKPGKTPKSEKAGDKNLSFKEQSDEAAFANRQLNNLLQRYKEILAAESHEQRSRMVEQWSEDYKNNSSTPLSPAKQPDKAPSGAPISVPTKLH